MPRDIRVRVGRTIRDQSLGDYATGTDLLSYLVDAARGPADSVGLTESLQALLDTGSTTNNTTAVYPTAATHPKATFNRSGNTLTSLGRRNLPVYDSVDGFVLGTTKPTWDNSGCRIPQAQLTTNTTQNLITTADNQVIEGLYLPNGRIEIRHKNVTIRDCVINIGYASSAVRALIQNNVGVACAPGYNTSGWRLEYVTVDPVNAGGAAPPPGGTTQYRYNSSNFGASWAFDTVTDPSSDDSMVSGFYMLGTGVAWRCKVRNVTDAFMPDYLYGGASPSGPAHIWGCYMQTRWLSYDSQQTDGTHNDGIQFSGQDGNTAIGNTIVCPSGNVTEPNTGRVTQGQCIVLTPYHPSADTVGGRDAAQESNTVAYLNWFSGSYTQFGSWLQYNEGGPGSPGVYLVGNRHGGKCEWPILWSPATNTQKRLLSGNVAEGTLTRNGGTTANGVTVPVNTTSKGDIASGGGTASTSHAGNDQWVEPGQRVYLLGKGRGTTSTSWIKTGTWTQTSGPAVTLTTGTTSDGATWAYFDAPTSSSAQTIVMQYQATGLADTDPMSVFVAPDQTISVPTVSVAGVVQSVAFGSSTSVTRTTTAGRTLVACVGHQSRLASTDVALSDTAGNVWTRVAASESSGSTSEGRDSIWICTNAASVTSVTATQSGASTVVALTLYELIGGNGGVRQATTAWTGTAPVETQVSATAGDFVVGIAGRYNSAPTTSSAGYTAQTALNVSTTYYVSAHAIAATTGSQGPTWNAGNSVGMVTAAIIPG